MSSLVLLIIVAVALAIVGLLFIPVRLVVEYRKKQLNIKIKYGILSFCVTKKRKASTAKPKKKAKKKSENKKKEEGSGDGKLDAFFNLLTAFYDTSDLIRKSIKIDKLNVNAVYGNGDAAFTGMAIGIAYAELYKLIAFLSCIFTVEPPVLTIAPDYSDEPKFDAELFCIVKAKMAHIIFAYLKFIKRYKAYC